MKNTATVIKKQCPFCEKKRPENQFNAKGICLTCEPEVPVQSFHVQCEECKQHYYDGKHVHNGICNPCYDRLSAELVNIIQNNKHDRGLVEQAYSDMAVLTTKVLG